MGQNYLRSCSLSLSGGGKTETVTGGGPTDLKIVFEIESHTLQSPDLAQFVVYNPSPTFAKQAQQEFKTVTFSAGYGGSNGLIFSGDIVETQYGEKIDNFTTTLLKIWCANSDLAYNNAQVSTSLAAGSTPMDMFNVCLNALQPLGVSMGQIIGVDLTQPKFPRGVVMAGMARDYLREIALSAGATYTLTGGKLSMIGKTANISGSPIVLSPSSGMIFQPIQRVEGIIVKCLINAAITINSIIKIASPIVSPSVNGSAVLPDLTDRQMQLSSQLNSNQEYRVLHSVINGDTRGQDWTMTLTTIGNGQPVNTTQAGLGYS